MAEHRALNAAPLVLAVESATAQASVALLRGRDVVGHRTGRSGQHHAETLLPMVDALLAEANLLPAAIEAFAVSIGPGGFTSLRIGLATVKGLAFASARPVVAVPTLAGLAFAAWRAGAVPVDRVCVPVLDARRGEVYLGAYRSGKGALASAAEPSEVLEVETILDAGVYSAQAVVETVAEGVLVGEGVALAAPGLERVAPGRFSRGAALAPDARAIGLLAWPRLLAGEGADAASLVPRYVRRAEAEAQRMDQRFE